ncbi:MAG TPA: hypothetical protein VLB73_03500 [Patescibacteria group bacterium]|nr:hypothetical protein [Patescibacteria group bacterium]
MTFTEKAKIVLVQNNTDVPQPPYVPNGWNPWERPYGPKDVVGITDSKRR